MMYVRAGLAGLMIGLLTTAVGALQVSDTFKGLARDLVRDGKEALTMEDAEAARALFERALVANPASVTALIGLGRAYEAQDKVPVSLKYYRHALKIEPNSLEALEAQSLAFLKRGLFDEADLNRAKLERLCRAGCPALTSVSTALTDFLSQKADASEAQGASEETPDNP